jgi:hypothetical protein
MKMQTSILIAFNSFTESLFKGRDIKTTRAAAKAAAACVIAAAAATTTATATATTKSTPKSIQLKTLLIHNYVLQCTNLRRYCKRLASVPYPSSGKIFQLGGPG